MLERVKALAADGALSREALLAEFHSLGDEYGKLLRQALKITRIGDRNQRKLYLANEQIERQKDELGKAYKKLELIASTDPLTQLFNRRKFIEKFRDERRRFERDQKPFSLVMGDIDDFKSVNDRYGHDCGDFFLVTVSRILRAMVRKQDVVGRWGGEEFILLLPGTSLDGGEKVAEVIRKKIAAEPYTFQGNRLPLTMTFGVSQFDGSTDIDGCIKQADMALYAGKKDGKNRVVISSRVMKAPPPDDRPLPAQLPRFYDRLKERRIMLDFHGAVLQDVMGGMAEMIHHKLSSDGWRPAVIKKVFCVFVELAQNVSFYSAERVYSDIEHRDVGAGAVLVGENKEGVTILTGNLVEKQRVSTLLKHCETINNMNAEELKQFYKERIKLPRVKGRQGGRVGLIDISRKAMNPILSKVVPINPVHSFLVLSVTINNE